MRFDFDFERTNLRRNRSDRRSEVKLERLTKILEGLIFRRPLAGHIDLDALSDEPFIFLPDASGNFFFHIVPNVPLAERLLYLFSKFLLMSSRTP
jgi:hypothetical protein